MSTETPLAVFRESRRFEGKRSFELHSDVIRITGSDCLGGRCDMAVPLAQLESRSGTLRTRSKYFWIGSWMILLGGGYLVTQRKAFVLSSPLSLLIEIAIVVVLVGLFLSVTTFRQLEFARFLNRDGILVFDIARSGPDKARFDEFIGEVAQQIRACNLSSDAGKA